MDIVEVGWGDVVWLRIATGGDLFHEMLGNYRVSKQLGIFLSPIELVS
jgi:hypothetical protein